MDNLHLFNQYRLKTDRRKFERRQIFMDVSNEEERRITDRRTNNNISENLSLSNELIDLENEWRMGFKILIEELKLLDKE